jgi:hypothetical protein
MHDRCSSDSTPPQPKEQDIEIEEEAEHAQLPGAFGRLMSYNKISTYDYDEDDSCADADTFKTSTSKSNCIEQPEVQPLASSTDDNIRAFIGSEKLPDTFYGDELNLTIPDRKPGNWYAPLVDQSHVVLVPRYGDSAFWCVLKSFVVLLI